MKLARVNLEAESLSDPRFALLERLLGLPAFCGGKLGLARCAVIWSWQTEHYTPENPCFVAPEWVIEMALEFDAPTAASALIRARLGEETPEGLRIKGSSHERTGWLWRLRQKSAAGVAEKRRRAQSNRNDDHDSQPVVDPESTAGAPDGEPVVNPLSSLLSVHPESKENLARAGDVAGAEPLTLRPPGKRPRKPRPPTGPKPQVHAPDEDPEPTERDRKVAAEFGLDIAEQWPAMFDHYRRKGWTTGSWASSWRAWCRKAKEFAAERTGNQRPVAPPRAREPTGMAATAVLRAERGLPPDPFAPRTNP